MRLAAAANDLQPASVHSAGEGPVRLRRHLVGPQAQHGRHARVLLDFRVYINCTTTRTTECDRTRGHRIHDGGRIVAHVTRVIDKTTMIMTVSATSAPDFVPPGPVRIGHDLTHDALAIFGGRLSGDPFCGKGSPPGYCGA